MEVKKEEGAVDEGWNWLTNAKKAHYFVKGRSLCGKWGCFGKPEGDGGMHHCSECELRLEKRQKKGVNSG